MSRARGAQGRGSSLAVPLGTGRAEASRFEIRGLDVDADRAVSNGSVAKIERSFVDDDDTAEGSVFDEGALGVDPLPAPGVPLLHARVQLDDLGFPDGQVPDSVSRWAARLMKRPSIQRQCERES